MINWGIVFTPFLLFIMPVDFFDSGESVCLSKLLANIECYACGLTRGTMHFIHFDFSGAWEFNKLTFIVVPLLAVYWLRACFLAIGKEPPRIIEKFMNRNA
jgi:hypothetical protein